MEHMAAQMDRQIDGAISENDRLANENEAMMRMVAWAYRKLHQQNYSKQEDALMLDRMKLMLENA